MALTLRGPSRREATPSEGPEMLAETGCATAGTLRDVGPTGYEETSNARVIAASKEGKESMTTIFLQSVATTVVVSFFLLTMLIAPRGIEAAGATPPDVNLMSPVPIFQYVGTLQAAADFLSDVGKFD